MGFKHLRRPSCVLVATIFLIVESIGTSAFKCSSAGLPQWRIHWPSSVEDSRNQRDGLYANKKKKAKSAPKRRTESGAGFGKPSVVTIPKSSTCATSNIVPTTTEAPLTFEGPPSMVRKDMRQKWKKRTDDGSPNEEVDIEIKRLASLYMEEYKRQQTNQNKPRRLNQVSTSPLLFTVDDFINPAWCERVQSDGSGCFDLMFPEMVADLLFRQQESELDGLLFNAASSLADGTTHFPDGLHMDTNGQVLFRHVTCILYLNTIAEECGGATVFPLARTLPNDPALKGANHLLTEKISHTRSPAVASVPGAPAAANLMEGRSGSQYSDDPTTETAIRIQPKAGRLLIFFSRDETGAEDPRSWHAGERILPSKSGQATEKRILTLFKQVDYGQPSTQVQTTFEDYLAPQIRKQRHWLQNLAELGTPIEYGSPLLHSHTEIVR